MTKKKIITVIGLSILFVIISILVIFGFTDSIDMGFYNFLMNFRCSFLDNYFILITKCGDVSFICGLVLGVILILRNKYSLLYGCLAVDCALTNKIVKHIIRRDRPDVLKLIKQGGFSYPSGHSMISMCMYGCLIYVVLKKIKNKYLKWFLVFIQNLTNDEINNSDSLNLYGLSRIYVGVHYLSDVVSGFILGLIILILYIELINKYFVRGN